MIKKYCKKNINFLIIFVLINTIIFSLTNCIIMHIDLNVEKSIQKVVQKGEIYLVDSDAHEKEYYQNLFGKDIIDAGNSDLQNQYYTYVRDIPIFYVEDFEYEDECIMDYATYVYNNYPNEVHIYAQRINDDKKDLPPIKVNKNHFSDIPGVFVSKKYLYGNDSFKLVRYYGIVVNDKNINNVCKYFDLNNRYNSLIAYYGDFQYFERAVDDIKETEIQLEKVSVLFALAMFIIYFLIFISFVEKNIEDYRLLYIYGKSKTRIILFTFLIPLLGYLFSCALTFIINLTYLNIYNTYYSSQLYIGIGYNVLIMWRIILTFTFIAILAATIYLQKQLKKDVLR